MDNIFDWKYYLMKYKDLRDANINTEEMALYHWNKYGKGKRYGNRENDPEPFKCNIFIISPIKKGGSHKYIKDIMNYLDSMNINYISINNLEEFNYIKTILTDNDLLIVQHLTHMNITFNDIERCVSKTNVKLILPIHDMYYLNSKENINNINIHYPQNKYNITHNLFNLAKYIIFPSNYIHKIYTNIINLNNIIYNYYIVHHNDININNNTLFIPKINKQIIKIGIITNVNIIKGFEFYKKLCYINKYNKDDFVNCVCRYSRTLINANAFITANPADLTKREPVYSKNLNSDAHNYTIHYYIYGYVNKKEEFKSKFIHLEGQYNENDIFDIIKNKNIHGLMYLNAHPETYSYALTKGIAMRLPILYTNIGAIGERLGEYNDNRYHVYTGTESYYKFIQYIIDNNGTGGWEDIDTQIHINDFYVDLFNKN